VSDPLTGMLWPPTGQPDIPSSVRHPRNSPPGSRCSPPDPGICLWSPSRGIPEVHQLSRSV